jgi:hypothetical protein
VGALTEQVRAYVSGKNPPLHKLAKLLAGEAAAIALPGRSTRTLAVLHASLAACRFVEEAGAAIPDYLLLRRDLEHQIAKEIATRLVNVARDDSGFVAAAIERMPEHVVAELCKCDGDLTGVAAFDLLFDLAERAFRSALIRD